MPDIKDTGYNRNLDFLNTGYTSLDTPSPQLPYPDIRQQPIPNAPLPVKDVLNGIFQNARQSTERMYPFISSLNINQPIRTPLNQTLRYDSQTYGFDPYNPNLENQYGDRQSVLTTWKNNLLKFGANTAASFIETLATIPIAINAAVSGDFSNLYDNELTNSLTDWMENLETSLPTYQTTAQKNNPVMSWIPFFGGSANNWGTLLKNLGFTAGAIGGALVTDAAVGSLTAGVGAAPLLPNQMARIFGKVGKFFSSAKGPSTTMAQSLARTDDLVSIVNRASQARNIVNKFRYGLAIGTSALAEGAFEANQTQRNIKELLTQEYIKQYNRDPQGEDLREIEEYAQGGGNAAMFANTALLTLTNSITFGSLFKPIGAAQRSIASTLGSRGIALKEGSVDVFEQAVRQGSKFSLLKSAGKVGRLGRVGLTEGFEEGSQFAITRTAEEYYKRKFNQPDVDTVDNFNQSLSKGLSDTLTTREGLESIFMGFLSGSIINVSRNALERRKGLDNNKNRLINSSIALLNSETVSGLFRNTYHEAVNAESIRRDMETSLVNGDIFEFKNLKHQQLFNFVESGVRSNRFDARIDQLNMLKELDSQEFEQLFGINFSEENKQTTDAFVDSVIIKANEIKTDIDKVNRVFKNPYQKGTNDYFVFEEYKTQLSLDLSEIKDNRRRIAQLSGEISQIAPVGNIDEVIDLTNDKGVQDTIDRFTKRIDELEDSINNTSDQTSDFHKDQVKQQQFLVQKKNELESILKDKDESQMEVNYLNQAGRIVNYYANGKTFRTDVMVPDIDTLDILTKAQDAFKLISATDRAVYHYQKLTQKEGFTEFFVDVLKEYNKAESNLNTQAAPSTNGQPPTEATQAVNEDVEEIEEADQGKPAPKVDAKTQQEQKKAANNKNTKEIKGKDAIANHITTVAKNNYLFTHVTTEQDAKTIAGNSFTVSPGTGVSSSLTALGTVGATTQINRLIDGEVVHRDKTNNSVVIIAIPKSILDRIKGNKASDKLEDWLAQNGQLDEKGNYTIPQKYNLGHLSGDIFVPAQPAEQAQVEQTTSSDFVSTDNDPGLIDEDIEKGKQKAQDKKKGTRKNSIEYNANPTVLYNRVLSKNYDDSKDKENLRQVLFSRTPQQVYDSISLNVRESTKGLKAGQYKEFPGLSNIYYTGFATDIELVVDGKVIGRIQPAERLAFKRNGQYVPLYDIEVHEYEKVTGNDLSTFTDFITQLTNYKQVTDNIQSQFKNGKTSYTNEEVKNLMDINVSYGGINYAASDASATLISELQFKGNKGSAILSLPIIYDKVNKIYERSSRPEILNKADLTNDEITEITDYLINNIDKLKRIDSRYIYLMKMPDGKFGNVSAIAARPRSADTTILSNIYEEIKNLPTELSKERVAQINAVLQERVYIADARNRKGSKSRLYLSVNSKGDVYVNVFNETTEYRKRIRVNEAKQARNFEEMVNLMNQKLRQIATSDTGLDKLNLSLEAQDFKAGILSDDQISTDQLESSLTVAAQPNVFNDYQIQVFPVNEVVAPKPAVEKSQPKKTTKAAPQPIVPDNPAIPLVEDEVVNQTVATEQELNAIATVTEGKNTNKDYGVVTPFTNVIGDIQASENDRLTALKELYQQLTDKGTEATVGAALGKDADIIYDLNYPVVETTTAIDDLLAQPDPNFNAELAEEVNEQVAKEEIENLVVEEEENVIETFEEGEAALFNDKEVIIKEKNVMGSGSVVYLISDGTPRGEQYVREDSAKLKKPAKEEVNQIIDEGLLKELNINQTQEGEVDDEGFTKSTEDENNITVTYVGLKTILETLKQKFNLPYSVVTEESDWKGRFEDGVVYINLYNVTRDTPFHEYLHPFIAVLKIDNPELYRNIIEEALSLEDFQNILNSVKKDSYYKTRSKEEQGDESLVRLISEYSAKNYNQEGKKVEKRYYAAAKRLFEEFKEWLNKLLEGTLFVKKKGDQKRPNETRLSFLPTNMTLQDIADITSTHNMVFDFTEHKDMIKAMNEFQSNNVQKTDDQKIIDRIKRKLAVLEDTAKNRVNSPELLSEMIAVKGILKNFEEAESIDNYVRQGIEGLSFANDEFKRITGKIKGEEKLTQKDIKQLNRDLDLVRNLLAFYDDVHVLFSRLTDDMDNVTYRRMNQVINQAAANIKSIKSRSIDLMTEWLYPYVEEINEKIAKKYPDYVITKEKFKNKLYSADEDLTFLQYWMGSVGSNNDVISAITRTAIFGVVEDNHLFESKLGEEIKIKYAEFLKEKGLKNDIKQTEEFYKQNYLRKATILERTEEKDDQDKYKYAYNSKWAFHQPFFFDLYVQDKTNFLETLDKKYGGERPAEGTPEYQKFVDDIFKWEETNGSLSKPAEKYRNAEFDKLYGKDKMFTLLYDSYNEGNDKYSEDQRLNFGIVPQVSNGKLVSAEPEKKGAVGKAKSIWGRIVNFALPQAEETTTSPDDLNLDGSTYRRIRTPYVTSLPEASVSLVLPETVFKYAGASNLTSLMKEVEPNVKTLKMVIEGNTKFGIEARKINKVTSDRKTIFDRVLKLPSSQEEKITRLNKQLTTWLNDVVYGDEEIQSNVKAFGRNIDLNKLGGNLAFVTALNNMAFNVTAGAGNITIGNVQSFGEALGGKYYTAKDWRAGQAQYFGNFKNFVTDALNPKKSKVTQLGIKYDAIQGEFRDKYGKNFVGSAMQRYATSDTIFFINHGAEHQIQLTGMLAIMNATKVRTNNGQEISLFDAHVINDKGFLRLRDDIIWTAEDERLFTQKLHGINKMLNGNYSKFDKVQLQRIWFGKLLLIYRKFMYNAFRQRYGRKRLDYEIGDVVEGSYRAFFKKLHADIKDYKWGAASRFLSRKGWTADEKYAYNKTLYELSLLIGTSLVTLALASADEDDEDEKSWLQNTLTLQMLRLRKDIALYSIFGLGDIMNVLQNPSAVILTLKKYADFFSQLIFNPFETYDRKTGAFDKGESVLKAKLFKALPIVRQMINFMSPEEQIQYYRLLNKH